MAFMYSVVNLGSVFFQGANNKLALTLGDGIITAHTAARRIIGIMMTPIGTITQAVDIKAPTVISSSIELFMKILAAIWIIPTLGFLGTCITEPVTWVLSAVFLVILYMKKRPSLYAI